MSSTDQNDPEAAIRAFCEDEFRPIAERVIADGPRCFAHGPDPAASSYYVQRERTSMRKADFETPAFRTAEEFADELTAMWRSQGFDALCPLAPAMARLAEQLKQGDAQSDEVSPFVYVMF